jgi:programmed cell death protein 5
MLAQSGQLRAKVTEAQLKELLGAVAEKRRSKKSSSLAAKVGGMTMMIFWTCKGLHKM